MRRINTIAKIYKPKKRRKGIHAKTKQSKNKGSKLYELYVKPYKSQGK
jgi:hypothetical protein